ncbi:putative efflux protein, MATE family [Alkalispirochaeta americana]|uniref:Putative efflux protein, MATE family n=1 Tax=Alkalispirochaeta americana TaxID=159291 RepID=A0A1N6PPF5_9SPIO|nr:MATE family efflux transporter [Alkalispirochaeta americana]SIQ06217.1 putative efflux protein, MATE family [Alkalispirochaeta americana]
MKRPDVLHDPVGPALVRLVIPMVAGALGIVLFNVVDTFFVGRLGALELAAMSYTFPIVIVAGSIASGLGVGASACVSRAYGAGDLPQARRLTLHAHLLSLAVILVLAALGLVTIKPFFTFLGAEEKLLGLIGDYMFVWYLGMPFMMLPMVGQNILQALGDSKTPSAVIVFSVVLNMVLDPLLIFGAGPVPALGIQGAAIATVIARGSTMVAVLWILGSSRKMFPHRAERSGFLISSRRILFVGLPASLTNLALPISMGVVTRLISPFGAEAIAGFGVATRLESFSLVFTMALAMVFTPFVGQNLGAGKVHRAREGYRVAVILSLVWGVVVALVFGVAGRPIAGIFTDTGEVVVATTGYLRTLAPTFGLLGVVMVTSAAFNGLHRPFAAAAVAFMRLVGLYLPLALIGRSLGGLQGLFWGLAGANGIAGVAAVLIFRRASRTFPVPNKRKCNDDRVFCSPRNPGKSLFSIGDCGKL